MKYYLAALLILVSTHTFSQISYTDFIQKDNKIEWAAEYDQILNITPKVKKFRINTFLFKELAKNGCIDSYKQSGDELKLTRFCLADSAVFADSITSAVNPYHDYIYDLSYSSDFITNEINAATKGNSKTKFDVLRIKQIFMYKEEKLQIINVLGSPLSMQNVHLSDNSDTKDKIVWRQYFSSLFNNSNHILTAAEKEKCIDYGNGEAAYNFRYSWAADSLPSKIFTLKNPSLSRFIYSAILSGKATAVDDKLNIIPAAKIFKYKNPPIEVPQFDDNGNMKASKIMYNEINPDSIYKFDINQHFYLDTIKKVFYSEVNYLTVVMKVFTSTGLFLGDGELFRVYFIKPSLYRKPVTKRFIND